METTPLKRLRERHMAGVIRAYCGLANVSYSNYQLRKGNEYIALKTSHLAFNILTDSVQHIRGIADAIGLRLNYTNLKLHASLMPNEAIQQLIFDSLEQLRVESLVDEQFKGANKNLDVVFLNWQRHFATTSFAENKLGLILFTIVQNTRSKLTSRMPDSEITALIEEPQFILAPHIGGLITKLKQQRNNQQKFACISLQIAKIAHDLLALELPEKAQSNEQSVRSSIPLPPIATNPFSNFISYDTTSDPQENFLKENQYKIFTTRYDRIIEAKNLSRNNDTQKLRQELDRHIKAQVVNVNRLASRFKQIFAINRPNSWQFSQPDGYLDATRLSQLITNPDYYQIFKRRGDEPQCDLVVSFLIDNSGSMKRQRYKTVAILIDLYCRALELAGAKTEVLGYSTAAFSGGRALRDWRKSGRPANPGRLNEALFVIYKDPQTPWRRAKPSISKLLDTLHYREGLDGEALSWAARRLSTCSEKRKILILLCDGAPMDSATANTNGDDYLAKHLKDIAMKIENSSAIELAAIGIDLDLRQFINNSISLSLDATLDKPAINALETLFNR